jgi:phenylpropionate dioxygenase-like ring-hydroxylating dioxygenase large terminal subunit
MERHASFPASVIGEDMTDRLPAGASSRWDQLVREDCVHRSLYTDPNIFEEEMLKIFGRTWVYLAHESEVPAPDDFKTAYVGRRPVIVTRDGRGRLHALLNRCRHRAATVCREERGSSKIFTCPYHGWAYRNSGELTGVPWPTGYAPGFDRSQLGLGSLRVESYRGFIFGTLDQAVPDLPEYLGPAAPMLDQWIDRAPGGDVVVTNANRMAYRGNWKLASDNSADGYHPAFSHRSLLKMAQRLGEQKDMVYFAQNPDNGPMYVQSLGHGHTFADQRPNYEGVGSYWRQQRPQPGREAYEQELRKRYGDEADRWLDLAIGSQMNLNIFPNLLVIGNQIQVIEPIAVDYTQLTWYSTVIKGVPDEINVLRMRTQEDFPNFGEPDDQTNFEECQRGLSIPEVEWVLCNRGLGIPGRQHENERGVVTGPVTDELVIRGFYQEWKRLMSADPPTRAPGPVGEGATENGPSTQGRSGGRS